MSMRALLAAEALRAPCAAVLLAATALLATATLLAGCAAVGPDYERPAVELPATYPDPGAGGAATAIDAAWWKLYGDPALDRLVERALERNADVRIAVARIEEADANLREAGASFLPQIDLTVLASRAGVTTSGAVPVPSTVPVIRNNVRLTAAAAYELDFWGRLRRSVEAVRAQALGTRYAKDVVSLSLAGLASQAYFSLRSLDVQIALTRETLAVRDEYMGIVRSRASGGLASDLDVNQAIVARVDAATQLRELQRQRALVEHQLGTLSGKLDLALPEAATLLALPVPPAPPPGLPSTLLERRPDIRQAEQQLVSANAQIGVARAAMLPTISLTGTYGGETQALSTLLANGSNIWTLGFGLALPIFDWGRLDARAEAAEARARQSLAAYQKAIETAFREVADGLTNLEQTTAAEQDLWARAMAARNTVRLARARYEAGYSPYLELLDAQRTANDAELAVVRNRQNRLSASVDLMKSLGGGWTADVPPAAR